jgi:PAS domain S-box-containing protein
MENQALKVPIDLGSLSLKLTQIISDKSILIYIQDASFKFYKIYPSYLESPQETISNLKEKAYSLFLTESFAYKNITYEVFIFQYHLNDEKQDHKNPKALQYSTTFIREYIELYLKNEINSYYLRLKENIESDNIFKLMFLKAHNAMAFATPDGFITHANESWAKMHSYNMDEITGKHLSIFHSVKQLENEVSIINKNALENGIDTREVGHINSKGFNIPTLMTVIKLENALHEHIGFAGIATDISEQKNLENRLITILESVAFGILIIDPKDFKILELNTAALKYIGLPKNQIVGKECTKFVCPSEKGKCPYKTSNHQIHNSERVLITATGERIPILKTVKSIDLGGKEVIIESFIDIRDQKEAQQKAEESAKLKTAFLSNISHELRTPLNHILGFTSLVLEDENIEETYREYLGIVKRSGHNLLRIIEDIVTISKIEAGHHSINENEFDLYQTTYKLFTKHQSEIVRTKSGIKILFENHLGANRFYIKADEMKVVQVVENLISNAIKYTEQGFVKIKVVADKSNASIIVSDSGKGIKKEDLECIFESFRQVETSDRKIYDGTGIGLTICKSLSNMIGGNIQVDSESGKGSSFIFNFPFNKSERLADIDIPDTIATPDLTGRPIMVVEDEKINFLYIKTLLQPTNAHVIWKQNGKEALEFFENNSTVDLILMDMQMPVMNGYIATEEIRKLNKDVTIIALTANVLADDRKKCLELGCNEYTTKPIQQDVLFWHLQHFIK